jgi:hypothetical protein
LQWTASASTVTAPSERSQVGIRLCKRDWHGIGPRSVNEGCILELIQRKLEQIQKSDKWRRESLRDSGLKALSFKGKRNEREGPSGLLMYIFVAYISETV